MLITSLLYGGVNVMFLGSLHYFRRQPDEGADEEAKKGITLSHPGSVPLRLLKSFPYEVRRNSVPRQ